MDKRERLYTTAYSFLGKDASPHDIAPDEYGCAETVSDVIRTAFPELRFPTLLSTRELYDYLTRSVSFQQTDEPEYGCIVLNVTGTGNGRVPNGHTGILGQRVSPDGSHWIMSNDSRSGTWEPNYTLNSWRRYYEAKGGMPTLFFIPI